MGNNLSILYWYERDITNIKDDLTMYTYIWPFLMRFTGYHTSQNWDQISRTSVSQNWSQTKRSWVWDQFWDTRVRDIWSQFLRVRYRCSHTHYTLFWVHNEYFITFMHILFCRRPHPVIFIWRFMSKCLVEIIRRH